MQATGFYTSANGAMVSAKGGERYTLSVDVDGNGSVDASASCAVPGMLSWVVPANGAEYAAGDCTASWNDSAANTPNHSAQYIAVFIGQKSNTLGAVYTGSERSFKPEPALAPDSYRGMLQTNYSQTTFTGVSVQGTLLYGAGTNAEVVFTIN